MTRDPLSPEMRRDLENAREWHRNRVSEKGYEFAAERAVRDLFLIIDHLTSQSAEKKKYSEKELKYNDDSDYRLTAIAKQLRRALDEEIKKAGGAEAVGEIWRRSTIWQDNRINLKGRVLKIQSSGSIREMLDLLKLIDKKIYGGKGE